ncbi:MAG: hypothetical protein AAFQ94_12125 [Bacteroidota bacterium]
MKSILLTALMMYAVFLSSCGNGDCEAVPSCLEPDLNLLTQIRIDLNRFSSEEIAETKLVRIDRFSQEVLDTIQMSNVAQFSNEIIIGRNSTISLTRSLDEDDEMPDLNFKVLIGDPVQEFDLTDIRVVYRSVECGCPEVLLESLLLDGGLVEINNVTLEILL